MKPTELIIINFQEIRNRSIQAWQGLPTEYYHWKPDEDAMSAIEMVRHVLQADYGWNLIINQQDLTNYKTPWENRPFQSVEDELEFAQPHRAIFLNSVQQFSEKDLTEKMITHPGNGELKPLGQYLLRIGYHESVHTGQFLSYLRQMKASRPFIWN